jgi:hypothetical protein
VLLVVLVVAVAAGCQLDVEVALDVEPDGTGAVTVVVALDEAAVAQVPGLSEQLVVDDLVEVGWTVTGPVAEADGRTRIRASKPFTSLAGAGAVLGEVSGDDGPFRDLQVRRSSTLVHDEWDFSGTVDLSEGLAAFSDEALRERLDGTDVGRSTEELVAAAGRPLEEAVTFTVAVALPGRTSSDAPGGGDRSAVWRPVLGEVVPLAATGRQLNTASLSWVAVGAVAVLALVVVLAVGGHRRRG